MLPLTLPLLKEPIPELESGSLAYEASTSPYMLYGRKLLQGLEPCPSPYKGGMLASNTLGARGLSLGLSMAGPLPPSVTRLRMSATSRADSGVRTHDLFLTKEVRCQLRHIGWRTGREFTPDRNLLHGPPGIRTLTSRLKRPVR